MSDTHSIGLTAFTLISVLLHIDITTDSFNQIMQAVIRREDLHRIFMVIFHHQQTITMKLFYILVPPNHTTKNIQFWLPLFNGKRLTIGQPNIMSVSLKVLPVISTFVSNSGLKRSNRSILSMNLRLKWMSKTRPWVIHSSYLVEQLSNSFQCGMRLKSKS